MVAQRNHSVLGQSAASAFLVELGAANGSAPRSQDGNDRGPQRCLATGISGRDLALGGHEGFQGGRGDQQGPGDGIFSVADYKLETDLFTAVLELVNAL
jgi:electron transfer flavoprotein alpha subunit